MIEKWTQLRFEELGAEVAAASLGEDASPDGMGAAEARLRSESARMALDNQIAMPSGETARNDVNWWEEYKRLRGYGWPWRVAVYVAWAALPKERRWPRTQDELAKEVLGLTSDRVIFQWRKKNPGIEDAIAVLQGGVLFEHRAGVIEALVASATNPNYKGHQDRKLYFEMIGDYTPRSEQNVRVSGDLVGDLSGLSEAELVKMAGIPQHSTPADLTPDPLSGGSDLSAMVEGEDHPSPALPKMQDRHFGEGDEAGDESRIFDE